MPGQGPGPDILRGLYGTFLAAAQAGQTTAEVWASVRQAAADWATSYLEIQSGETPSPEAVAAETATILSGVSATDVSAMRGVAGQQVEAMRNLMAQNPEAQITGKSVFQAPWSQASQSPYLSPTYRMRIQRTIEFRGFTTVERTEWATYDLEGPLTNVADALRQAQNAFDSAEYNARARTTGVLAYSIEAV